MTMPTTPTKPTKPTATSAPLRPFVPRFANAWLADAAPLRPRLDEGLFGALLVADLVGFSARAEALARQGQSGIEQVQTILADCFGQVVALVEAAGGEVCKFAGDALIAWWPAEAGADLAHAAAAAASAGLRLQAAAPGLLGPAQAALGMRVMVGAGPAWAALAGGELGRWEPVLGGAVFDQVAALVDAPPGEVALSAAAFACLRGRCDGQPFGQGGLLLHRVQGPAAVTPAIAKRARGAAPLAELSAAAALVPRHIVRQLGTGQIPTAPVAAELLPVEVLFIAVEPAPAAHELAAWLLAGQQAVYAVGGSVVQCLVDDKARLVLLAAWGVPGSSHADDAERAVLAALRASTSLGTASRLGIGLARGQVYTGLRGGHTRCEFALIGSAVIRAARWAERASRSPLAPSRLLCDAAMAEAVPRFHPLALPPQSLKGLGMVPCFSLGHAPPAGSPPAGSQLSGALRPDGELDGRERRPAPAAGVLRGRDAELAMLHVALHWQNAEAASTLLVLEGEPGIGKSHLLTEFARRCSQAGVAAACATCEPLDQADALRALRPLLLALLGLSGLSPIRRQARLRQLLQHDPAQCQPLPLLSPLLDLGLAEPEPLQQLSDRARQDALAQLLLALVQASADGQARLLLLEDVQWLDSPSWAVLDTWLRRCPGLLLVLTTRLLADYPWPARAQALLHWPGTQHRLLAPLADTAVGALLAQELGLRSVPKAVLALVHERTQGLPLFVRQLAGMLRDAAVVRDDGQGRHIDLDALRRLAMPDSVQGAVVARVDRLPGPQRSLLKRASVAGRQFSLGALLEMTEPALSAVAPAATPVAGPDPRQAQRQDLANGVADLVARGLLLPGTDQAAGQNAAGATTDADTDPVYAFAHALVRDAVYKMLPLPERRGLHARLAAWYERLEATGGAAAGNSTLIGLVARIADHWAAAHDVARAPPALENAAAQAMRGGAYREAQGLWRRLLSIAEQGFGDADPAQIDAPPTRQAQWRFGLGLASYNLGELGQAETAFEAALALLGQPVPQGRRLRLGLAIEIARAPWHLLRLRLRADAVQAAAPPVAGVKPPPRHADGADLAGAQPMLAARVLSALSRVYHLRHRRDQTLYTILRNFNQLESKPPCSEQMIATSGAMYLMAMAGMPRLADACLARVEAVQRLVADPARYVTAAHAMAVAYLGQGRMAAADALAERAQAQCLSSGELHQRRMLLAVRANAAELAGHWPQARGRYSELLRQSEDSEDGLGQAWGSGGLAMLAQRSGQPELAHSQALHAQTQSQLAGERMVEWTALGTLVLLDLAANQRESAQQRLDEVLLRMRGMARFVTAHHALVGLDSVCEACLWLWATAGPGSVGAQTHEREVLRLLQRLSWHARVFAISGPTLWRQRGNWLALNGRLRQAGKAWQRALALATDMGIPWEQGRNLQALAWLAQQAGNAYADGGDALQLSARAQAVWHDLGVPPPPVTAALRR